VLEPANADQVPPDTTDSLDPSKGPLPGRGEPEGGEHEAEQGKLRGLRDVLEVADADVDRTLDEHGMAAGGEGEKECCGVRAGDISTEDGKR